MTLWEKIQAARFWKYFVPAVFFILFAWSLQSWFIRNNRPRNVRKHIETVLRDKEKLLLTYMDLLSGRMKNAPDTIDGFSGKELKSLKREGLSVFLYRNDSLVYWTTNIFSAPNRLTSRPVSLYPMLRKTYNGWYFVYRKTSGTQTTEGRILIKREYPFENEYLQNDFQDSFNVPSGTEIIQEVGTCPVFSPAGKYLFSLKIPDDPPLSETQSVILLIAYTLALIFLIKSVYGLIISLPFLMNRIVFFVLFAGGIILIRFVQVFFHLPGALYETGLFGPGSFSSSFFFPSLGDFFINSICLLMISWVFYNLFSGVIKKPSKSSIRILLIIAVLAGLIAEFFIAVYLLRDIVVNSTIPFDLQDISNLGFYSFIGFLIISSFFLSLFLIGLRISGWLAILTGVRNTKWVRRIRMRKYSATNLVIYIVGFSILATITLNYYNEKVEKEKRKLLAIRLATERDHLAEMMFAGIEESMKNDTVLKNELINNIDGDSVSRYLQKKYFRNYWNNYSIQVTNCTGEKILRVQPQNYLVDCNFYFSTLINNIGKPTFSKNFYYLDYGYGFKNYLAILHYPSGEGDSLRAYIEISSKLLFRDLGYPELLIDKRQVPFPEISGYSYAFYRNGRLTNRLGNYNYTMALEHKPGHGRKQIFYSARGMNHFIFPVDNERTLVLSKKENSLFDRISPFSYLFLFFSLFAIIFYVIVNFPNSIRPGWFGLGTRLQMTMSLILVSSLVIVGFLVIKHITGLNNQKNQENLNERAHSILIELQHNPGTADSINSTMKERLGELLTKLSNVYFSDINIYDTNGRLIATSRPEVFESGLVSKRMNGDAFRYMRKNFSSYYMTEETIGNSKYNSAYLPLYNSDNRLLAYINLPYFTRQEELKREISSFLIAFINLYVFLIIIGLILSIVVTKYITRPLRLLTTNIGRIGFGRNNEKLEWSRNDEIGKLVEEYNRMVTELEKSAGLLARSERESAWREMARQVAHEIKNPLTPMKLSVQHLRRAWNDKAPDWDERLLRFTETMTEQIETLAAIAAEFSDFAKMPVKKEEKIDVDDLIENVLVLYRDIASIRFVYNKPESQQFIYADRKQMNRVFTNLINNAVYAVGDKEDGMIIISAITEKDSVLITITDNGTGISRDQADHIFQPNFTTKSGGMGLGLAIVKSIVQTAGGEIHFHSEEGKGTTFMLRFPVRNI